MRAFLLILIAVIVFASPIEQLCAKRFGGGRSFGVSRSVSNVASRANPVNNMRQGNRWAAPMLGLLAGGIIGSLLWSNGFGSGLMSWLVIGGAIYLIIAFLRHRSQAQQPHYQSNTTNQMNNSASPFRDVLSKLNPQSQTPFSTTQMNTRDEEFIRQAKVIFLRLQAAYDAKDIHDIRRYTTPEVLAEIQLQLQERGDKENHTEVLDLKAEILEKENEDLYETASVRFSGTIQEDALDPAHSFEEIWHFKAKSGNNDLFVAGIQQV